MNICTIKFLKLCGNYKICWILYSLQIQKSLGKWLHFTNIAEILKKIPAAVSSCSPGCKMRTRWHHLSIFPQPMDLTFTYTQQPLTNPKPPRSTSSARPRQQQNKSTATPCLPPRTSSRSYECVRCARPTSASTTTIDDWQTTSAGSCISGL